MSKTIDPRSSSQLPIPDLHRLGCTAYFAGHNVHWIQALHTAKHIRGVRAIVARTDSHRGR